MRCSLRWPLPSERSAGRRVGGIVRGQLSEQGFLKAFLSRRDWVYLLSLLVPFIVYNLALKASSVVSVPGLTMTFDLMRSDIFFNLGYALFWIGLFAAVRDRAPLGRATVVF